MRFDVHNKTTDNSNGFATAMFQYFRLHFVAESERKIFDFCFLYVDDSLFLLCVPTLAGRTPSLG